MKSGGGVERTTAGAFNVKPDDAAPELTADAVHTGGGGQKCSCCSTSFTFNNITSGRTMSAARSPISSGAPTSLSHQKFIHDQDAKLLMKRMPTVLLPMHALVPLSLRSDELTVVTTKRKKGWVVWRIIDDEMAGNTT